MNMAAVYLGQTNEDLVQGKKYDLVIEENLVYLRETPHIRDKFNIEQFERDWFRVSLDGSILSYDKGTEKYTITEI